MRKISDTNVRTGCVCRNVRSPLNRDTEFLIKIENNIKVQLNYCFINK